MISNIYAKGNHKLKRANPPKAQAGYKQGRKGLCLSKSAKELRKRQELWNQVKAGSLPVR